MEVRLDGHPLAPAQNYKEELVSKQAGAKPSMLAAESNPLLLTSLKSSLAYMRPNRGLIRSNEGALRPWCVRALGRRP